MQKSCENEESEAVDFSDLTETNGDPVAGGYGGVDPHGEPTPGEAAPAYVGQGEDTQFTQEPIDTPPEELWGPEQGLSMRYNVVALMVQLFEGLGDVTDASQIIDLSEELIDYIRRGKRS